MATERQIEANRRNAGKSTGPRTPEGKARSARNALRSGLDAESQFVLFESPEQFAALQDEYFRRFLPRTPEERYQVDCLIRNEWLLRRMFVVEGQLWNHHIKLGSPLSGAGMGEAFDRANPVFMRLQRRVAALETSYRQAYQELQRLQTVRLETSCEPPAVAESKPEDLPGPSTQETPVPGIAAEPEVPLPQSETGELGSFFNSAAPPLTRRSAAPEPRPDQPACAA